MNSAASSALASRQASRGTTPLPVEAQLNPYRLPRFWRGYALGGLTAAGLLGLFKYGSAIKDFFYNKFRKPLVQTSPTPTPKPLALPTPKPKRKSHVIQNNRHH